MAKLVLVNHQSPGIGNNKPPLGLGYLVSYLGKYLDFHDIVVINTGDRTLEKILESKPDLVGFTVYTAGFADVLGLLQRLRMKSGVPILVGGPHITCLPRQLPKEANVGFIGESEQTLLEVMSLFLRMDALPPEDLAAIPGLVFWSGDQLRFSTPRKQIIPIDRIPMPDREVLGIRDMLKPSQVLMSNEYLRGTTMLTSRGCPYHCIYCHVSSVWGAPRYHSPEYVVNEMSFLAREYGVEAISLSDDLFAGNSKRITAIIDGMKKHGLLGKIRFQLDLRASMVNDDLILLLKQMGAVKIDMGLESGSDRILWTLKGKDVSAEINLQAVKTVNRHGIGTHCCFMIGAPAETVEDIRKTQDLIRKILDNDVKNFCQVTVATPLPGTPLWEQAIRKGLNPETIDWRQFSLSPLTSTRDDFYINEHIPFEEFSRYVKETASLGNSRRIESILNNFSWGYMRKMFTHPKLALSILMDHIRHKGFRAIKRSDRN